MALIIDIKGKYKGPVPNVLSHVYRYTGFADDTLQVTFADGKTGSANVTQKLNDAWSFITQRANIKGGKCNAYFKSLPRGKTLKEVLSEGDIVIHCLEPKDSHSYGDLPWANTAGRDIGLDPTIFFETSRVLACTLVHELAHVAGATTNTEGPGAGDAEEALNHCYCHSQFHLEVVGSIESVGADDSRVV